MCKILYGNGTSKLDGKTVTTKIIFEIVNTYFNITTNGTVEVRYSKHTEKTANSLFIY